MPDNRWSGSQHGGVKTPAALVLPDHTRRFARTAARLKALAPGHPVEEWLRFMADVAEAQHVAASAVDGFVKLDQLAVQQSMAEGLPPLAAASHRRDHIWRHGLRALLDSGDAEATPSLARAAIGRLREMATLRLEALADDFFCGRIQNSDLGDAFYVAAALQVYFTRLAASLPKGCLNLLPERSLCPCCGSTPVAGVVSEAGDVAGTRYLHCSLCGTAWNHVRAMCITCHQSRSLVLRSIRGEKDPVQVETCDGCRTYAKMLYRSRNAELDPFADDLATIELDVAASDAGWSRHAPNPLLLIGSGHQRCC